MSPLWGREDRINKKSAPSKRWAWAHQLVHVCSSSLVNVVQHWQTCPLRLCTHRIQWYTYYFRLTYHLVNACGQVWFMHTDDNELTSSTNVLILSSVASAGRLACAVISQLSPFLVWESFTDGHWRTVGRFGSLPPLSLSSLSLDLDLMVCTLR